MMNVKVTVVFKRFLNNEYHHFSDYVETNPKRMHPFSRGNNKFKINFDQYIAEFRSKFFKQELCTECFMFYPKKKMIYTDKPYVEAKLDSESWWYCSEYCVDYRYGINKYASRI